MHIQAKVTAVAPPNGKTKVDAADAAVHAIRGEIEEWTKRGWETASNVSLAYKPSSGSYRWHATVTMVKPW